MACTAATQLSAPRQAFRACSRSRRAAVVVRAAAEQQQPAGLDRRAALMGLAAALVAVQTRPALAEGEQCTSDWCAILPEEIETQQCRRPCFAAPSPMRPSPAGNFGALSCCCFHRRL